MCIFSLHCRCRTTHSLLIGLLHLVRSSVKKLGMVMLGAPASQVGRDCLCKLLGLVVSKKRGIVAVDVAIDQLLEACAASMEQEEEYETFGHRACKSRTAAGLVR